MSNKKIMTLLNVILLKERDKLEPSLIEEIEKLLKELDCMEKKETKKLVFSLLGKILDKLPQIIALIFRLHN